MKLRTRIAGIATGVAVAVPLMFGFSVANASAAEAAALCNSGSRKNITYQHELGFYLDLVPGQCSSRAASWITVRPGHCTYSPGFGTKCASLKTGMVRLGYIGSSAWTFNAWRTN